MVATIKYEAWVKGLGEQELWHLGTHYSITEAHDAVAEYVGRLGLRCLFRWDANLYRCSDKAEGVYGMVKSVDLLQEQDVEAAQKFEHLRTEQLELIWSALSNANPGSHVPHERYLLWLETIGEVANATILRRGE